MRRAPLLDDDAAAADAAAFSPRNNKDAVLCEVLKASGPAILNNVAAPAAAAVQLALLGHAGTHAAEAVAAVAVWTAVTAVTSFCANVANFVTVVTMARVGHALGAQQWLLLGRMARAVIGAALLVGAVLALALWLARTPVLAALSLNDKSRHEASLAAAFLPPAILRVPPLLLLRACSSILCGYQRVRLASAINTSLALADTLAFYVALHVFHLDLPALGFIVAATCASAALGALLVVALLPPDPKAGLCRCRATATHAETFGGGGFQVPTHPASLLSLACDSANVLIRSLLLSGSVLSLTVAIAPLGSAPLNAHAVILQLWMLTSYIVDGFADAGTMIGSRLLGEGEARQMRWLTTILALLGLGTGLVASALLVALHRPLVHAFTRDAATIDALAGGLWTLLVALQPINALVFVYDGLLYATQSFRYVRNALAAGVLLVFAPSLGLVVGLSHSLLAVWAAKAGLNGWRCLTALFRIHVQLWPQWVPRPRGPPLSAVPSSMLNADMTQGDVTRTSDFNANDFVAVD